MPVLTPAQRFILFAYAVVVAALVLWPPFYFDIGDQLVNAGHAFLFDPPEPALIAYRTLAVYILGVTLAAGALLLAVGGKGKGEK